MLVSKAFRKSSFINIPILPEAFLTFASKSSVGPSYVANGHEDHKTFLGLNEKKEKEEKEHGETTKGPPPGGP